MDRRKRASDDLEAVLRRNAVSVSEKMVIVVRH
jgi:hypothetical protein